jgi:hypothetical protein
VSLRKLTNLRLADLRLTAAQQRSTSQNLPSDLCTTYTLRSVGSGLILVLTGACRGGILERVLVTARRDVGNGAR